MDWHVVHVRVNDAATGRSTPVRLRLVGPGGHYLPPLGRAADVPTGWNEQVGTGSVVVDGKEYAYTDGACEVRLPTGRIDVEISKGPEYEVVRETVERRSGQMALRFLIARRSDLAAEGWHAGDSRAHFLSPAAAVLEGAAEGLRLVNILAGQWGGPERLLLAGLTDFSGQQPALERDECQAVVNTINDGGPLGRLALLHCHRTVFPLTLADAGFEKYTLEDWCHQCHRKQGLVVWPAFPSAAREALAGVLLGNVDAVEWSAAHPLDDGGLRLWYALLDAGRKVPLVGGSGKESNAVAVGAVRTYAHLGWGEPYTYAAWIAAERAGQTFATRGPAVRLHAKLGSGAAATPTNSKPLAVRALAEGLPPDGRLEIIHNSEIIGDAGADAMGRSELTLEQEAATAGWLAARCRDAAGLAAHTSPVYLDGPPRPVPSAAVTLLRQHLAALAALIDSQPAARQERLRETVAAAEQGL